MVIVYLSRWFPLLLQTEARSHPQHCHHHQKLQAISATNYLTTNTTDPNLNTALPTPPNQPPGISNMAIDKATQITHSGPSSPHTATQATPTTNAQPNYLPSAWPIMATPSPATPGPSIVTLHQSGHETTTTAGQSIATVTPAPQPQFIRFNWTAKEVTELDELRAQGLSWSYISRHFAGKSANACRKRHERHKTTTTAATTLTTSQAQRFANMLAPVNYSNMTPAQILQMHHQFLQTVREVPRLRYGAGEEPEYPSSKFSNAKKDLTIDYLHTYFSWNHVTGLH